MIAKLSDPGRTGLPSRGLMVALVAMIVAAVLLVSAPASLLDRWLAHASADKLRLAQIEGTLWHGSARVVLVDPARMNAPQGTVGDSGGMVGTASLSGRTGLLAGWAVPGTVHWRLSPRVLLGLLDLSVQLAPTHLTGALASPGGTSVQILGSLATGFRIGAGSFEWPDVALESLGSPWNTLRPVASLKMHWDTMVVDENGIRGSLAVQVLNASSALSTVRPLGSWQLGVQARGKDAALKIETIAGPVFLEGDGQWREGVGVQFRLAAWPDATNQAMLTPLLNLIGPREGGRNIIRVGV